VRANAGNFFALIVASLLHIRVEYGLLNFANYDSLVPVTFFGHTTWFARQGRLICGVATASMRPFRAHTAIP
jgi:hypothetical protein